MSAEKIAANPYPGFRPYKFNESNLFFGREKQINEIVSKLTVNKFVALTGPSGSGKSSLISAGIIPALTARIDTQESSAGKTIITRPGSTPFKNFAQALVDTGIYSASDNTDDKIEKTINILQEGHDGIKRILGDASANIQGNLVIVIDQFEELFLSEGTNHSSAAKEREKFTELLAELHNQEDVPVYLIISIRSDFIAECYQFLRLSQLINQSNHILSPMTSEEILEVIHKPAESEGGQIDQALEKKIIDELYGKPDLLPSLQYYLNKIWDYRINQGNYEKPLSLKEYEAVGNIDIAISTNADKIFDELPETGKEICRKLYNAITGKDANNRDVSNPKSIADITSITGSSIEETIDVIDRFRQPGAAFLNPSYDSDLTEEAIIELSHISLIRLWDRLDIWVKEEADSVKLYKHLAEKSRLYQMKKLSLLKNNDLKLALQWRDDNDPTSEWATWHHTAFERTMAFLDKSEEEYKREEEEKLQKPYKNLRRAKISAIVLGIATLVSTGMFLHTSDFFVTSAGQTASSNRELTGPNEQSAADESNVQESGNMASTTDTLEDEDTGEQLQENITRGSNQGQRTTGTQSQTESQSRGDNTTNRESISENISSGTPGDGSNQEISTEESLRNKLQEIGPTLVARTSEIENNPDLKALLAVQTQIFRRNYNLSIDYPGHYTNLHSSLKALLGDNFNAYRGHSGSVNSVVFRPNSSIFYSTSSDGKVLRWDINDERKTSVTLIENSGINNSLAISSNGQWLAVATNGQGIKIFNPTRNNPFPITINRGNNRFTAIDFHPDNQHLIFADSDNNINKYNITTGSNQLFTTSEREIFSISVSPDGSKIAAGTRGGQIIIWTGETDPVKEVINHDAGNDVHVVQFNYNGARLASGSLRGDIRIWDVTTGNLITSLDSHTARVVDIKFSPKNDKIASTSFDGTIKLWDINRLNAEPLTLSDHGSWVLSVSFNYSGDRLVSGSRQENRLMSWHLETDEMIGMICSGLPRNLTSEEWNRYIGRDIPYMETCVR